jgi:hypothetical protein
MHALGRTGWLDPAGSAWASSSISINATRTGTSFSTWCMA